MGDSLKKLRGRQTAWEKIYAQYKKTGKKWASLRDAIHPSFFSFIDREKFYKRSVLDLGCGDGKYLTFLQNLGFSVAGIDSSPTAIKLARQALGKRADLRVADIYANSIPNRRYDLIISIATIHHARKGAIKKVVGRIYSSLPVGGQIFITFSRMSSLHKWATFENAKQVAPGTFVPFIGPEKGLPHSFYEKTELEELFSRFKKVRIVRDDRGRWIVTASR